MKYFVFLFSIILCFSCNFSQRKTESFNEFNTKFHSDSLFQISRINFPIEGKYVEGFNRKDWSLKNWQMLRKPVGENISKEFQISTKISDSIVIEKIWNPNSGFHTEIRFKAIKGKWYLIYFDDINL